MRRALTAEDIAWITKPMYEHLCSRCKETKFCKYYRPGWTTGCIDNVKEMAGVE